MSWRLTPQTEVSRGRNQTLTKMMGPYPIHKDTGCKGVLRIDNRVGKIKTTTCSFVNKVPAKNLRNPSIYFLSTPPRTPSQEDNTLSRLRPVNKNHSPRRATWCICLVCENTPFSFFMFIPLRSLRDTLPLIFENNKGGSYFTEY